MTKATNGRLDQWGEILAEFFPATGSWSGTTHFYSSKSCENQQNEKTRLLPGRRIGLIAISKSGVG